MSAADFSWRVRRTMPGIATSISRMSRSASTRTWSRVGGSDQRALLCDAFRHAFNALPLCHIPVTTPNQRQ
eukprot:711486-Rhodomonas_salina.2